MEHVNAEILRAIADGKKVQYRNTVTGNWEYLDVKYAVACRFLLSGDLAVVWRIAPKTIKIGDHEVPEPCWLPPRVGQKFWTVSPFTGTALFHWDGSKACRQALEEGFVHLTEEAARQHYEAIKSLLGGQPE